MSALPVQPDLFATATSPAQHASLAGLSLAGLSLVEDVVAPAEEQALIAAIDDAGLAPFRFHGWVGKRLTTSFGWRYDFDDGSFGPTTPIPEWLRPLRAAAARVAGLAAEALEMALLIRYDPGAGIGWHRDRPQFEHIVGVSLGAAATMRFRLRRPEGGFDRVAVRLPPRSVYHLTGPARGLWEHSLPEVAATRWSVTFRSLSEQSRR
jgi:alkylated DNA repair dioxygenase AlkB